MLVSYKKGVNIVGEVAELFQNNLMILFAVATISIISYTNFNDNQRIFIFYFFVYTAAYFSVLNVSSSLLLLVIMSFIFLEYLTEDKMKLTVIVKFRYKLLDYIFMMLSQYFAHYIVAALLMIHLSNKISNFKCVFELTSFILLLCGTHQATTQPFKIKTITQTLKIFDEFPVYNFIYNENMQDRFDVLCAIEDKTYFKRCKSYSCVSFEYISYWLKKIKHSSYTVKNVIKQLPHVSVEKGIKIIGRGYSTPEKQLIRTIGVERGYDKHKFQRKFYEIIYSKIIFSSLKDYHQANSCIQIKRFREYLLYIYFKSVQTKINGIRYQHFNTAFNESEDITKWSLEGVFIACMGLSFREINEKNLNVNGEIIDRFF